MVLLVFTCIGFAIYWFALQYHGDRPAKWQRRADGIAWVARYVAADIKAAFTRRETRDQMHPPASHLSQEELYRAIREMEENLGDYDDGH